MNFDMPNLNIDNIRSMVKLGSIDNYFMKNIIANRDSISMLRYKHNIGMPWGFWDDVIFLLREPAEKQLSLNFDTDLRHNFNICNYAYFFPSHFSSHLKEIKERVFSLSYKEMVNILSIRENALKIIELYKTSPLESSFFSEGFLFSVFHASIVYCDWNSHGFLALIGKIKLSLRLNGFSMPTTKIVEGFIESFSRSKNESAKKIENIALFVSGQFRGDIDSFHKHYSDVFLGKNVDIYISTWNLKGNSTVRLQQMHRLVGGVLKGSTLLTEQGFCDYINAYLKSKVSKLDNKYFDAFSFAKNTYVNIDDEKNTGFSCMNNAEKMYYHNSVWINKLGSSHFHNYDVCIKIRPDTRMDISSWDLLAKNISSGIISEETQGFYIRPWGLGVGDQVIAAKPHEFCSLMQTFNDDDIAQAQCSVGLEQYQGHTSLANKALKLGLNFIGNDCLKISMDSSDTLSEDEIKRLVFEYEKNNS